MASIQCRSLWLVLLLSGSLWAATALAAGTYPLFDPSNIERFPFPSDLFTVADATQLTGLRVQLPSRGCTDPAVICDNIGIVNQLDGFSVHPRISIPFSGPIEPRTVNAQTVAIVELDSSRPRPIPIPPRPLPVRAIGVNQVVWDPATNSLHLAPEVQLKQDQLYLLIVTDGVRDPRGNPILPACDIEALFGALYSANCIGQNRPVGIPRVENVPYMRLLQQVLRNYEPVLPPPRHRIAVASLFTTMSVTSILAKMRAVVGDAPPPAPANFQFGGVGTPLLVFPTDGGFPVITINIQTTSSPVSYAQMPCPLNTPGPAANVASVVAFGKYSAPGFLTPQIFIPPVGTSSGTPAIQDSHDLIFMLFLPAGTPPAGGWPVAIFGHGYGDTKARACLLHNELNAAGIAVIAISGVGQDGGPLSNVSVQTSSGTVTFPWGGRSVDLDGNGVFGATEGLSAVGPYAFVGVRDGVRQTAADLFQLVRVIAAGVDVNGDGQLDLNPQRIYYFGHSNGGNYGTLFMSLEPAIRAGVLIAPWTILDEPAGPAEHATMARTLGNLPYTPTLLNVPPPPAAATDYDANIPLRNLPPLVNSVPGAMALQELFDRVDWVRLPGSALGYISLLAPPQNCLAHPCPQNRVLVQMAKGDLQVANPTESALVRAGNLEQVTTNLRWDLYYPSHSSVINPPLAEAPHSFILMANPELQPARQQIADFFASDGSQIDVLPPPYWETPIPPPLPEATNFLVTVYTATGQMVSASGSPGPQFGIQVPMDGTWAQGCAPFTVGGLVQYRAQVLTVAGERATLARTNYGSDTACAPASASVQPSVMGSIENADDPRLSTSIVWSAPGPTGIPSSYGNHVKLSVPVPYTDDYYWVDDRTTPLQLYTSSNPASNPVQMQSVPFVKQ